MVAIWPATFLQGPGAATGIALINTIGSFGALSLPPPWSEHPQLCMEECLCSLDMKD